MIREKRKYPGGRDWKNCKRNVGDDVGNGSQGEILFYNKYPSLPTRELSREIFVDHIVD
jgi:hypothetical protein